MQEEEHLRLGELTLQVGITGISQREGYDIQAVETELGLAYKVLVTVSEDERKWKTCGVTGFMLGFSSLAVSLLRR